MPMLAPAKTLSIVSLPAGLDPDDLPVEVVIPVYNAPDDLQMDVFMISLVSGWHPIIEGSKRLQSE